MVFRGIHRFIFFVSIFLFIPARGENSHEKSKNTLQNNQEILEKISTTVHPDLAVPACFPFSQPDLRNFWQYPRTVEKRTGAGDPKKVDSNYTTANPLLAQLANMNGLLLEIEKFQTPAVEYLYKQAFKGFNPLTFSGADHEKKWVSKLSDVDLLSWLMLTERKKSSLALEEKKFVGGWQKLDFELRNEIVARANSSDGKVFGGADFSVTPRLLQKQPHLKNPRNGTELSSPFTLGDQLEDSLWEGLAANPNKIETALILLLPKEVNFNNENTLRNYLNKTKNLSLLELELLRQSVLLKIEEANSAQYHNKFKQEGPPIDIRMKALKNEGKLVCSTKLDPERFLFIQRLSEMVAAYQPSNMKASIFGIPANIREQILSMDNETFKLFNSKDTGLYWKSYHQHSKKLNPNTLFDELPFNLDREVLKAFHSYFSSNKDLNPLKELLETNSHIANFRADAFGLESKDVLKSAEYLAAYSGLRQKANTRPHSDTLITALNGKEKGDVENWIYSRLAEIKPHTRNGLDRTQYEALIRLLNELNKTKYSPLEIKQTAHDPEKSSRPELKTIDYTTQYLAGIREACQSVGRKDNKIRSLEEAKLAAQTELATVSPGYSNDLLKTIEDVLQSYDPLGLFSKNLKSYRELSLDARKDLRSSVVTELALFDHYDMPMRRVALLHLLNYVEEGNVAPRDIYCEYERFHLSNLQAAKNDLKNFPQAQSLLLEVAERQKALSKLGNMQEETAQRLADIDRFILKLKKGGLIEKLHLAGMGTKGNQAQNALDTLIRLQPSDYKLIHDYLFSLSAEGIPFVSVNHGTIQNHSADDVGVPFGLLPPPELALQQVLGTEQYSDLVKQIINANRSALEKANQALSAAWQNTEGKETKEIQRLAGTRRALIQTFGSFYEKYTGHSLEQLICGEKACDSAQLNALPQQPEVSALMRLTRPLEYALTHSKRGPVPYSKKNGAAPVPKGSFYLDSHYLAQRIQQTRDESDLYQDQIKKWKTDSGVTAETKNHILNPVLKDLLREHRDVTLALEGARSISGSETETALRVLKSNLVNSITQLSYVLNGNNLMDPSVVDPYRKATITYLPWEGSYDPDPTNPLRQKTHTVIGSELSAWIPLENGVKAPPDADKVHVLNGKDVAYKKRISVERQVTHPLFPKDVIMKSDGLYFKDPTGFGHDIKLDKESMWFGGHKVQLKNVDLQSLTRPRTSRSHGFVCEQIIRNSKEFVDRFIPSDSNERQTLMGKLDWLMRSEQPKENLRAVMEKIRKGETVSQVIFGKWRVQTVGNSWIPKIHWGSIPNIAANVLINTADKIGTLGASKITFHPVLLSPTLNFTEYAPSDYMPLVVLTCLLSNETLPGMKVLPGDADWRIWVVDVASGVNKGVQEQLWGNTKEGPLPSYGKHAFEAILESAEYWFSMEGLHTNANNAIIDLQDNSSNGKELTNAARNFQAVVIAASRRIPGSKRHPSVTPATDPIFDEVRDYLKEKMSHLSFHDVISYFMRFPDSSYAKQIVLRTLLPQHISKCVDRWGGSDKSKLMDEALRMLPIEFLTTEWSYALHNERLEELAGKETPCKNLVERVRSEISVLKKRVNPFSPDFKNGFDDAKDVDTVVQKYTDDLLKSYVQQVINLSNPLNEKQLLFVTPGFSVQKSFSDLYRQKQIDDRLAIQEYYKQRREKTQPKYTTVYIDRIPTKEILPKDQAEYDAKIARLNQHEKEFLEESIPRHNRAMKIAISDTLQKTRAQLLSRLAHLTSLTKDKNTQWKNVDFGQLSDALREVKDAASKMSDEQKQQLAARMGIAIHTAIANLDAEIRIQQQQDKLSDGAYGDQRGSIEQNEKWILESLKKEKSNDFRKQLIQGAVTLEPPREIDQFLRQAYEKNGEPPYSPLSLASLNGIRELPPFLYEALLVAIQHSGKDATELAKIIHSPFPSHILNFLLTHPEARKAYGERLQLLLKNEGPVSAFSVNGREYDIKTLLTAWSTFGRREKETIRDQAYSQLARTAEASGLKGFEKFNPKMFQDLSAEILSKRRGKGLSNIEGPDLSSQVLMLLIAATEEGGDDQKGTIAKLETSKGGAFRFTEPYYLSYREKENELVKKHLSERAETVQGKKVNQYLTQLHHLGRSLTARARVNLLSMDLQDLQMTDDLKHLMTNFNRENGLSVSDARDGYLSLIQNASAEELRKVFQGLNQKTQAFETVDPSRILAMRRRVIEKMKMGPLDNTTQQEADFLTQIGLLHSLQRLNNTENSPDVSKQATEALIDQSLQLSQMAAVELLKDYVRKKVGTFHPDHKNRPNRYYTASDVFHELESLPKLMFQKHNLGREDLEKILPIYGRLAKADVDEILKLVKALHTVFKYEPSNGESNTQKDPWEAQRAMTGVLLYLRGQWQNGDWAGVSPPTEWEPSDPRYDGPNFYELLLKGMRNKRLSTEDLKLAEQLNRMGVDKELEKLLPEAGTFSKARSDILSGIANRYHKEILAKNKNAQQQLAQEYEILINGFDRLMRGVAINGSEKNAFDQTREKHREYLKSIEDLSRFGTTLPPNELGQRLEMVRLLNEALQKLVDAPSQDTRSMTRVFLDALAQLKGAAVDRFNHFLKGSVKEAPRDLAKVWKETGTLTPLETKVLEEILKKNPIGDAYSEGKAIATNEFVQKTVLAHGFQKEREKISRDLAKQYGLLNGALGFSRDKTKQFTADLDILMRGYQAISNGGRLQEKDLVAFEKAKNEHKALLDDLDVLSQIGTAFPLSKLQPHTYIAGMLAAAKQTIESEPPPQLLKAIPKDSSQQEAPVAIEPNKTQRLDWQRFKESVCSKWTEAEEKLLEFEKKGIVEEARFIRREPEFQNFASEMAKIRQKEVVFQETIRQLTTELVAINQKLTEYEDFRKEIFSKKNPNTDAKKKEEWGKIAPNVADYEHLKDSVEKKLLDEYRKQDAILIQKTENEKKLIEIKNRLSEKYRRDRAQEFQSTRRLPANSLLQFADQEVQNLLVTPLAQAIYKPGVVVPSSLYNLLTQDVVSYCGALQGARDLARELVRRGVKKEDSKEHVISKQFYENLENSGLNVSIVQLESSFNKAWNRETQAVDSETAIREELKKYGVFISPLGGLDLEKMKLRSREDYSRLKALISSAQEKGFVSLATYDFDEDIQDYHEKARLRPFFQVGDTVFRVDGDRFIPEDPAIAQGKAAAILKKLGKELVAFPEDLKSLESKWKHWVVNYRNVAEQNLKERYSRIVGEGERPDGTFEHPGLFTQLEPYLGIRIKTPDRFKSKSSRAVEDEESSQEESVQLFYDQEMNRWKYNLFTSAGEMYEQVQHARGGADTAISIYTMAMTAQALTGGVGIAGFNPINFKLTELATKSALLNALVKFGGGVVHSSAIGITLHGEFSAVGDIVGTLSGNKEMLPSFSEMPVGMVKSGKNFGAGRLVGGPIAGLASTKRLAEALPWLMKPLQYGAVPVATGVTSYFTDKMLSHASEFQAAKSGTMSGFYLLGLEQHGAQFIPGFWRRWAAAAGFLAGLGQGFTAFEYLTNEQIGERYEKARRDLAELEISGASEEIIKQKKEYIQNLTYKQAAINEALHSWYQTLVFSHMAARGGIPRDIYRDLKTVGEGRSTEDVLRRYGVKLIDGEYVSTRPWYLRVFGNYAPYVQAALGNFTGTDIAAMGDTSKEFDTNRVELFNSLAHVLGVSDERLRAERSVLDNRENRNRTLGELVPIVRKNVAEKIKKEFWEAPSRNDLHSSQLLLELARVSPQEFSRNTPLFIRNLLRLSNPEADEARHNLSLAARIGIGQYILPDVREELHELVGQQIGEFFRRYDFPPKVGETTWEEMAKDFERSLHPSGQMALLLEGRLRIRDLVAIYGEDIFSGLEPYRRDVFQALVNGERTFESVGSQPWIYADVSLQQLPQLRQTAAAPFFVENLLAQVARDVGMDPIVFRRLVNIEAAQHPNSTLLDVVVQYRTAYP